jgi:hypothetical protein
MAFSRKTHDNQITPLGVAQAVQLLEKGAPKA